MYIQITDKTLRVFSSFFVRKDGILDDENTVKEHVWKKAVKIFPPLKPKHTAIL